MPRRKATTHERDRAIAAVRTREAGRTYEEIRVALGYRTVGAVKMAVSRLLARNEVEGVADYRRVHGARLESLLRALWPKAQAGGLEAIRTARPLLDSIAKLYGLDAPARLEVAEGLSQQEFAEKAAELLAITGDAPLRELAGLPPAQEEPRTPPWEDNWSNIGTGYETPLYAAVDTPPTASSGPSEAVSQAVDDGKRAFHLDDQDAEPAEPVEVVAELVEDDEPEVIVPTPGGFTSVRRLPTAQVWGRSINAARLAADAVARHRDVLGALQLSSDPVTSALGLAHIRAGDCPGSFTVTRRVAV